MRRAFFIALFAVLMAVGVLGTSCSKKEQPAKKEKMVEEMQRGLAKSESIVVASVNGNKITMNDLIREMNALGPRFVRPGERPTPEIDAEVRKRALDNLVFRELAVEEAGRQGMEVQPGTVDSAVKDLRKQLGSEEAFKAYLTRMAITGSDIGNIIRKEHLFQMIASKEIFEKVKKPDSSELKEIYEKEKSALMLPERFVADDVFFAGKNTVDVKKKAEEVLSELKSNHGDLSKLSTGNFIVRQITVTQDVLPGVYSTLEKMKPGGVSGVIEERDGLHIVKLERRESARQMTFEEAKDIIARNLTVQAVEKRKEAWEKQLKKNAKIVITLKEGEGIKPVY
jgi:peptidyl-prolyl cis-trans isomerase C